MQRLRREFESYVGSHPWLVSSASVLVGFVIALLLPTQQSPRSSIPGFKEGFLIVLSTAKLLDPAADLELRGGRVQFVHRGASGAAELPCRVEHPPLVFSANERNVTLSGSLEELEATILSITADDMKNIDLTRPQDPSVAPCRSKVKIIYGQEG